MAKKTKEEKFDSIKQIGKEIDFDLQLTSQAKNIIERIDNFPVDHFKFWWKKHFGVVNGSQLHRYLDTADGIIEVKQGD